MRFVESDVPCAVCGTTMETGEGDCARCFLAGTGTNLVTRQSAEVGAVRRSAARRALASPQMRDALASIADFVKGATRE